MSSMFIKYSTALVKTIGDEELRPVTCFTHAIKIRRFSILEKSQFPFWESEVPHDISLMDILEPSSSVPDAAVRVPFQLSDPATKEEEAGASVMSGADVTISGEAMEFQGSFQYQVLSTPYETWAEFQKRKLLDPEPVLLRQCRERSINLYVVTETVKLLNSLVLHDISSMKDEGVGEDRIVKETKLTLPQGMVMAYKMKPLVFKEKGWDILHIADEKQKCFPELGWEMQPLPRRAQGFCRLDFRHLQAEVSHYVKKAQLLEKVGNVVFSSILAMLGDREALQDLEDKLEQKPLGHLDGPGGAILNALRESSYDKSANSEDSISYLLGVINMLSDLQHDVLAWSVKKKILLQQRDLVRSILEPNFKYPWNIPFTIKPELLAPLQGEDLAITYVLLEECGLRMEPNSPRSIWNPEAKTPLSALYAALTVLQQLAEA